MMTYTQTGEMAIRWTLNGVREIQTVTTATVKGTVTTVRVGALR
jgi:hypothetical protein